MQRKKSDDKSAGGIIDLENISEIQNNILNIYINTYHLKPGDTLKINKYFFSTRDSNGVETYYNFELTQPVTIAGVLDFTDNSPQHQSTRDYFFNQAKAKHILHTGYCGTSQGQLYYNLYTIEAIDEFGCYKFKVIDTSSHGKLGEGAYARVGKVIGVWKYSMFDETDFQYYPKIARWVGKVNHVTENPDIAKFANNEFTLLSSVNPFSAKRIATYTVDNQSTTVLTSEFFAGFNLAKLLGFNKDDKKARALSTYQRFSLSIHACRNFCRLKGHNIMHRDIKPDNFVAELHPDGDFTYTKLIDLNLSRHMSVLANDNAAVGSYLYGAPEIFKGSGHNSKSDNFSHGLTLAKIWNDISLERHTENCKKMGYDRYVHSFIMERASQVLLSFDMFEDIIFSNDANKQADYESRILAIVTKMTSYYEGNRMEPREAIERLEGLRLQYYKELNKIATSEAAAVDNMHRMAVSFANDLMNDVYGNYSIQEQSAMLEAKLITCINTVVHAPRLFVDVVGIKLLANCKTKEEMLTVATQTFQQFNDAFKNFLSIQRALLSMAVTDNDYPAIKLKSQFVALKNKFLQYRLDIDDMPYLTHKMQSLMQKLTKVPALHERIELPDQRHLMLQPTLGT